MAGVHARQSLATVAVGRKRAAVARLASVPAAVADVAASSICAYAQNDRQETRVQEALPLRTLFLLKPTSDWATEPNCQVAVERPVSVRQAIAKHLRLFARLCHAKPSDESA